MSVFKSVVADIHHDEAEERTQCLKDWERTVWIVDETSGESITIEDVSDDIPHRYTITNESLITRQWLAERLVITPKAQEWAFRREAILDWLELFEPWMLMTLSRILVCFGDSEDEFDACVESDPVIAELLTDQFCELPNEALIGTFWATGNVTVVNVDAIVKRVADQLYEGYILEGDALEVVNTGILQTLAHEIRHLAQSNLYLPDELLQQQGDNEDDAERFARSVDVSTWVLK